MVGLTVPSGAPEAMAPERREALHASDQISR